MVGRLYRWFDRNVLELGRELRLSFLPPLMVYGREKIFQSSIVLLAKKASDNHNDQTNQADNSHTQSDSHSLRSLHFIN